MRVFLGSITAVALIAIGVALYSNWRAAQEIRQIRGTTPQASGSQQGAVPISAGD